MLLPIYAYGQPVLRQVAKDIAPDYPGLEKLITDMWETMYHAQGVGLAAPQIGVGIRLFVVDTAQITKGKLKPNDGGIKQVFINAHIVDESGEPWSYEEGCLSIPDIHGDVERPNFVHIKYLDENFQPHEATFDTVNARVIQHEYDHIDGILFTDHLKPLKKRLVKNRLEKIRLGQIEVSYKMRFVKT